MKRDICCFYPRNTADVFNAYVTAINSMGKQPVAYPITAISFDLGFSLRFNMNGGTCTLRFMPYNNGTAVSADYYILQAIGARVEAHYNTYTNEVERMLGCMSQPLNISPDMFINYINSTARQAPNYAPNYVPAQPSMPNYAPQRDFKFCTACGTKLSMIDKFCTKCGTKQP